LEHGPYRKLNGFSCTLKIPGTHGTRKFNTMRRSTSTGAYSYPGESIHTLPQCFFKIHFVIIIPSMSRFFILSVSFRFSHQEPLHISLFRLRVMTPQTLFDFDTANNFW